MKKFISLMLCICICFSSTVFCFADFSSTDSTTLSNIYKYMPTASQITTLNNTLSTINTRVLNIYNALFDSNHSVAYWVQAINSWLQPIYTSIQDILKASTDPMFNGLSSLLGYPTTSGDVTTWNPYLRDLRIALTRTVSGWNPSDNAHSQIFDNSGSNWYTVSNVWGNGSIGNRALNWLSGSPIGNLAAIMQTNTQNQSLIYQYRWAADLTGYNATQTYSLWTGNALTTESFTPSSSTNGIYKWFSYIQAPVARLSYVLASDERIEAQEAAAANEQAVVDNFIDSSGSGASSTSDFNSVSDLSSGFKNNISSDASVSGIWNIFNSDNFGWFSQETADQLDTTSTGTRTLHSSGSYPTPLLDQQTEDILKYIGGDNND